MPSLCSINSENHRVKSIIFTIPSGRYSKIRDKLAAMPAQRNAKKSIISAAASIVKNAGAGHLTIEAVAAKANLSKGGVLYHFPNKRALLEGMLTDLIDRMEHRRNQHAAALSGRNVQLRSLILAEKDLEDEERATSLAILAAAAEDPTLLDPARVRIADWFATVEQDATDESIAITLLLALEGVRFLEMLNLLPASKNGLILRQQLLALTEESQG